MKKESSYAILVAAFFYFGLIADITFAVSNSACPAGTTMCKDTCTDLQFDLLNCGTCGNQCSIGKACINGTCTCLEGQTLCNETCRDTNIDSRNCGSCRNVCPQGQMCLNGTCSIATSETLCNGFPADLRMDEFNCGKCGNNCPDVSVCTEGQCVNQYDGSLPTSPGQY